MIIYQQKSVGDPHGAKVWLDLVLRSTDSELFGTIWNPCSQKIVGTLACHIDQKPIAKPSANGRGYKFFMHTLHAYLYQNPPSRNPVSAPALPTQLVVTGKGRFASQV